jgi:hypothetical protein
MLIILLMMMMAQQSKKLRIIQLLAVFSMTSLLSAWSQEQGLVVYYSFDAAPVAQRIVDQSGRGNDGIAHGTTHHPVGISGGALAFNGINDWVSIINPYVIEPWEITQYSVSLWFMSESDDNFSDNRHVISDNRRYQIAAAQQNGQPVLLSYASSYIDCCGGTPVVSAPLRLGQDDWHHAVLVVDEQASPSTHLYVDGQLVGSSPESGANHGGYGLLIGAVQDGRSEPRNLWIGLIDEVRIYNRALPDDEIIQLTQAYRSGRADRIAQHTPALP